MCWNAADEQTERRPQAGWPLQFFFIFKNKFLLEKGLISLHNNFSPRCFFFRRYKILKISLNGDLVLQGAVAQYLKENGFTDAREKFIEEANVTNVSLFYSAANLLFLIIWYYWWML